MSNINLYGFTYPAAVAKFPGYILVKIGDSIRHPDVRINEQGGSAEWEGKIIVGRWPKLTKIYRDYLVHGILTNRGLHHQDGKGTEWFKIPGETVGDAYAYIDRLVTELEGERARPRVVLRNIQRRTLDGAMRIISRARSDTASIIANLCPRFGKTIWALMLFNRISKRYGNRVMLLPAYWLSVHTSFIEELNRYRDFNDIRYVDIDDEMAEKNTKQYLKDGLRVIIPLSLHGDVAEWQTKHRWVSKIPNQDIFNFADEGDFGTHTENQIAKLEFLFKK